MSLKIFSNETNWKFLLKTSHFQRHWEAVLCTKEDVPAVFNVKFVFFFGPYIFRSSPPPSHGHTFSLLCLNVIPQPHLPSHCSSPPDCDKRYFLVTIRLRLILFSSTICVIISILTEMVLSSSSVKAFLFLMSLCSQSPPYILMIQPDIRLLSWRWNLSWLRLIAGRPACWCWCCCLCAFTATII